MFRKPEVKVEVDQPNRGTPYRTCSIAVYVNDLDRRQMDRVRASLSRIISSPDVTVLAAGNPSAIDSRRFVRLRMAYYGEQVDAGRIEEAVRSVL